MSVNTPNANAPRVKTDRPQPAQQPAVQPQNPQTAKSGKSAQNPAGVTDPNAPAEPGVVRGEGMQPEGLGEILAGRAAKGDVMLRESQAQSPELAAMLRQSGLDLDVSPQGKNYIQGLSPELQSELGAMSSALTDGPDGKPATETLQGKWANFIGKAAKFGGVDVNALVQMVLRESYMETTQSLYMYAEKVRYYNNLKKEIRDELTQARNVLADHSGAKPEDALDQPYDTIEVADAFTGKEQADGGSGHPQGEPAETLADLEEYIKGLEEKLNSVGDDAQLANVDLQNMLQKQQQTMQMMSNISKMLHDTAMAIIRKIGG